MSGKVEVAAQGVRAASAGAPSEAALAAAHGKAALAAYGLFGLPLAMAALPLYVHLPKFYASDLGLSLTLIAAILFATRAVDAISDPLIGHWSDATGNRRGFVLAAIPLLALGMVGLFHPPADRSLAPVWLACMVVVTYLGFSLASIAYQAWGAGLSADTHERTRVTAAREIFSLVGVVTAAAMPQFLGGENATGLGRFALVFAVLVMVCGAITLLASPAPAALAAGPKVRLAESLRAPLANSGFRWLIVVFVLSGIAASIPSTLVLFFIDDVIGAAQYTGLFLVLYFLAGAAGMPLWVLLSKRIGKKGAWLVGMAMSVAAFVWAYALGAGDLYAYGAICILSGLALGADLALPASILADVIDRDARAAATRPDGSYFGFWNLVTKANLALSAGIALPALAALGYTPGVRENLEALSITYALLPCAFKLAAAAVLAFAPLAGAQHVVKEAPRG